MALAEEFRQIGYDIIGAAYAVRNEAGLGLREIYYKKALGFELEQKGYSVEIESFVPALYKGYEISDAFKADLVIDKRVVIETKAIAKMGEEEVRQIITYLKMSKIKLGYLINFGAPQFIPGKVKEPYPYTNGIYRFVNGI